MPTDDTALTGPDRLRETWKTRIIQAKEDRKQYEPTWHSNIAFADGQQWQVWDTKGRTLRHISDMDERYADRRNDLYTDDRIREYLQSAMGELGTDDDRPELLTAQEGDQAEQIQKEINAAVAHAWDYEVGADNALSRARRMTLTMGVSAIWCRRDPSKGELVSRVPVGQDGSPQLDQQTLDHLQQAGTLQDGSLPKFKPVKEGQTVWAPVTAFGLLTPPGVVHEDDFPWEIIVRPVLLDTIRGEYGSKADRLVEDTDIQTITGITTSGQSRQSGVDASKGRLRNHVWLYTCFTRPCHSYPEGHKVVLASNDMVLLDEENGLPYEAPDGTPRSGVHYFHWWRLDDRFWSRSLVEGMKDPQRVINEMVTTSLEIIRRGYPKVFVKEGDLPHNPAGLPMEKVELKQDAAEPNFFAGMGPGAWMWEMKTKAEEGMAHASTLSPLRLGENPQAIDTYSALALLNENEQLKRSDILTDHKQQIRYLVEDTVWDIRQYWPDEKLILVAGPEDRIAQESFQKSKIPDFYVIKPAKGSPQPRSQGAKLKMVDAIWLAAVNSGAVALDPERWTRWYSDSIQAGEPLELPEVQKDLQEVWAAYENQLLLNGEAVSVADEDIPTVHIPQHREGQIQARAAGDVQAYMRFVQHVDEHIQKAAANAAKVAQAQQTPAPPGLHPVPPPPVEPPQFGGPSGPGGASKPAPARPPAAAQPGL